MTKILGTGRVVRETATLIRRRALVIELRALSLCVRLKGLRWAYDVDYEAAFQLGGKRRLKLNEQRGRAKVGGEGMNKVWQMIRTGRLAAGDVRFDRKRTVEAACD